MKKYVGLRTGTQFGPGVSNSMDSFNLCAHQLALLPIFLIHSEYPLQYRRVMALLLFSCTIWVLSNTPAKWDLRMKIIKMVIGDLIILALTCQAAMESRRQSC